jgi:hypothetical protein
MPWDHPNNNMKQMAMVVLDKTGKIESKYFAGDPATAFHELRRFLYTQGVDTKLYSTGSLQGNSDEITASEEYSVRSIDNAFFSEFRTIVAIESSEKRIVLNTLILVMRVFFDSSGNGGTVQLMLNHLHDGIFELNGMYGSLCGFLDKNGWESEKPGAEVSNFSLTANMIFQHPFRSVHDFSSMYHKLKPILESHQLVGSHLPIESPF